MALKLAILKREGLAAGSEPAKTLPEGRLTIGRGAENDWTLPDPDRTISKHHCFIEGSGDTFRLTDCSTNGVFVNDGDEPIGAGTTVILRNGDRLQIGPYEIAVELIVPARPEVQTGFPLAPARQRPVLADVVVPEAPLADERPDELTAAGHDFVFDDDGNLGGRRAHIPEDDQDVAPARGHDIDRGSPLDESFVPPPAVEQIPDDWDEDLVPGSADRAAWASKDRPPSTLPEPDAATPPPGPRPGAFSLGASLDAGLHPRLDLDTEAPPPGPPTAPIPPPGSNGGDRQSDSELLAAFLSGLAVDGAALSTEDPAAMMRTAGEIVRASVEGLMAVLAARREIKGELRLTATEFKPAHNNPLKFSPEAQDAILQLLVRRERGFLEPKAAVVEGFADIKSHQLAVLAGMQEAWRDLLERFDPKALEQRLGQDSGLAGLLTSKKARCWDAYTEIYKVIAEEARDDFEALFGRKIARAYEEQIDKHRDRRP